MLHSYHTGNQTKYLRGTPLRLEYDFLVRDELLRRGCDGPFAYDSNLRDFQFRFIWVMSLYSAAPTERQDKTDPMDTNR
jgi:hypothetical protein